jgi:ElaB/YqjD/DUF883 family membrane-anchored ribosome-binding protein
MTRSVEDIRRESENTRAQFTATVEQLRSRINETTEDIRYRVSPEGIKSEVSDFVAAKSRSWIASLRQQAMDNPMQAIAAGAAIAVPALRVARGIPVPLLMIGAGFALASPRVRARVSEAAAPAVDKATAMVKDAADQWAPVRDAAADATAAVREALSDGTASLGATATDLANQLSESAAGLRDQFGAQAESATDFAREKATDFRNRAADLAEHAPAAAGKVIAQNAPLIGALGLAIGAIIAAALPATRAENVTLGKARDRAKDMAADALESGFATAKSAVLSSADAATQSIKDAGLDAHVSRVTQDMGEKLKSVAEDAVTTAFEPSDPIDAGSKP